MAIIVMSVVASAKNTIRTTRYPPSSNRTEHPKNTEKIGQDLSASGGLIQKIYEVDPLTCPKCRGRMGILAFIEDEEVIKKILKHLGLWPVESLKVEREVKARPPPRVNPSPPNIHIDYSDSQVPTSEDNPYRDPDLYASGVLPH